MSANSRPRKLAAGSGLRGGRQSRHAERLQRERKGCRGWGSVPRPRGGGGDSDVVQSKIQGRCETASTRSQWRPILKEDSLIEIIKAYKLPEDVVARRRTRPSLRAFVGWAKAPRAVPTILRNRKTHLTCILRKLRDLSGVSRTRRRRLGPILRGRVDDGEHLSRSRRSLLRGMTRWYGAVGKPSGAQFARRWVCPPYAHPCRFDRGSDATAANR